MSNLIIATQPIIHYVVLPGHGRQPGIYCSEQDAHHQTSNHPGGAVKRLLGAAEALAYWAKHAGVSVPRFCDGDHHQEADGLQTSLGFSDGEDISAILLT